MVDIAAEKAKLRAVMMERRASAAGALPDAGKRLAEVFDVRWLGPDVRVVAGYRAMRDEIDPLALLQRLIDQGYAAALPQTPPRGDGRGLTFRLWRPGDPLIRRAFGVEEPTDAAAIIEPDVVLAPLLAFDKHGNRLGYGAGHYDRTLAALRRHRPVRAIGLAYAAQEIDAVAVEPHDAALDGVVTECGWRRVRAGPA